MLKEKTTTTQKFNFISYENIPQYEDETKVCSLKKLNEFVKSRSALNKLFRIWNNRL